MICIELILMRSFGFVTGNESCMQCLGMLKCPAPTLRTCYASGLLLATACLMLPTEPTGQIDACFEAFDTLAPCRCLFDNTKLALSECFNEFFESWNPNIANFGTSYVKPLVHNADNVDSGVLTLIAVRDFNGRDFSNFHGQDLIKCFKGLLLHEVLSIQRNYAKTPAKFVQSIDLE